MKTCPLCGERNHDGPCYAELRALWREQDHLEKVVREILKPSTSDIRSFYVRKAPPRECEEVICQFQ